MADWLTPQSSFQQTWLETECRRFRVASQVKLDNLNETTTCPLSRGTHSVCFGKFESVKTLENFTTQYNFHYHVYTDGFTPCGKSRNILTFTFAVHRLAKMLDLNKSNEQYFRIHNINILFKFLIFI